MAQPQAHQGLNLASLDESQSSEWCMQWLARELSRQPEAADLYRAGKALYQSGRYRGASKLLRLYVEGEGCEMPGHHLLAYALYMCDEKRAAIQQARRVVNCGFDGDWQLLIEMQVDVDRADGLLPLPPEHIQAPQ